MIDEKYYKLLSERFLNSAMVGKEIVLLESLLNLPKGNELYLSDIHGEYEPFLHVLKNGAGIIKEKIKELFGEELQTKEIDQLASIIYYPKEKLEWLNTKDRDWELFYELTLYRLVRISRDFASIYTNRRLQKLLPEAYGEIILELIAQRELGDNNDYYKQIVKSVIDIDHCDQLIISFAKFIQRLAVHKIHIIGDIFDRGPGAEIIMDKLIEYHSVDIQWGNHDMVWMGAASGSQACITNVLRLSLRYANTDTLQHGYGINLVHLASFAIEHYRHDISVGFNPKVAPEELINQSEQWLNRLMHKAISIIQFKIEGQLIKRRPEFDMDDRLLLDKINFESNTVLIDGISYPLNDTYLPTIDPKDLHALTDEEQRLMDLLTHSFLESKRLQQHVSFLYENGGMYKISNNSLLYHGCIPATADGQFKKVNLGGETLSGRALFDYIDGNVRMGYFGKKNTPMKQYGEDLAWYLWTGADSPIFGKDKMTTFERYFLDAEEVQEENMNAYYDHRDSPEFCQRILEEFGLTKPNAVIINGHVPVEVKKGESPVKADGKLVVIDGGFSKAYQGQTGIAGYSLIFNSFGKQLIAHESFDSTEKAISEELDIAYSETILHQSDRQLKVKELDDGQRIITFIEDLKTLLQLFQSGQLKERSSVGNLM